MKTFIRNIGLLLVLSMAFVSCGKNYSFSRTGRILEGIESYIHERPDSALAVLESIDPAKLRSARLRAEYSLWYTAALDKNYIDTTDLEVIRPAYEYYSRHGAPVDKMRANYYKGCIYVHRHDDVSAMNYYMLALEDSSKVEDNHYKELINSAISDIFSRNFNSEQEIQYALDAIRYSRLANCLKGEWVITGHLASAYANARRWEDSEITYKSFFSMPIYDTLMYCKRRIGYAKELLLRPEPDAQQCLDLIGEVSNLCPRAMTVEAYCLYASASQELGNDSLADSVLDQLMAMGVQQEVVKYWRCNIRKDQGRYKEAFEDLRQSVMYQDSVVMAVLKQSLVKSQRDYLNVQSTILKRENEIVKYRNGVVIALLLLVLGAFITLYFRRKAILNRRIEDVSALNAESQQMLALQKSQTESTLSSLRKQFADMFKAQFKSLNDLCGAYLSPVKKDRKDKVYAAAMKQLDMIVNDKDSLDKFLSLINESLDGIMNKLRADLPNHDEHDFRFLAYVIVGFDAKTISSLTGYSVGTVYTKKNRLKKEISELKSVYRDYYMVFID